MNRLFSTTAFIGLISGAAAADGLTYGYGSYEFSNYDLESDDIDVSHFVGAVEYEVNQFLLSADFDRLNVSFDGGSEQTTFYSVGVAFKATPEILAGAGLTGIAGDGDEANGFEVFGQYSTSQFGVALNVAKPSDEDDDVLTNVYGTYQVTPDLAFGVSVRQNSEQDETSYELNAGYKQGPIDVRGAYDGFSDTDAGIFGVRGTYEVTPDIRVLAGYQTIVGDDVGFDLSGFSVGGGYQVAQTVWVDAFYGQISGGAGDIDRLGIQLTFETGGRQRIDNAFTQDNIDDQTAGFGGLFGFGS